MKTLVSKEIRETIKLAVLGALCLTAMLVLSYYNFSAQMRELLLGETDLRFPLQPLTGPEMRQNLMFFCVIFGGLLGWLQGHHDRQQGLWGFLLHRPVTLVTLFLAKTIAGLSLYALAAGLPLLVYITWAITPGHVAAPYESAMLLPVLAFFLFGLPFYFAGMLVGLRPVRWFGSRLIPIGAAIVIAACATVLPEFWQALLWLAAGTATLAVACAGSFHPQDGPAGRPAASGLATALALAAGWCLVFLVAGVMLGDVLGRSLPGRSWFYYVTGKDGMIYRVTRSSPGRTQITDLKDQVVLDPETHGPISVSGLQSRSSPSETVFTGSISERRSARWWSQAFAGNHQYRATPGAVWFYLPKLGRLAAYDTVTRRFSGTLGPEGFATNLAGSGAHFSGIRGDVFTTPETLYRVNVYERIVRPWFAVPAGEGPLLGVGQLHDREGLDHTIAATSNTVYIIHPDGGVEGSTPYQPSHPQYPVVRVCKLEPAGRFAIWFEPGFQTNQAAGFTLPARVQWINGAEQEASVELPVANRPSTASLDPEQIALAIVLPPLALEPLRWISGDPHFPAWKDWLQVSLPVTILIALPTGLWWMRRYRLARQTQLAWGFFLVLGGFPALLALFTARGWPARVPCPACRRRRVVNRGQCEHCGARFPGPARQGIEIFESEALVAVGSGPSEQAGVAPPSMH